MPLTAVDTTIDGVLYTLSVGSTSALCIPCQAILQLPVRGSKGVNLLPSLTNTCTDLASSSSFFCQALSASFSVSSFVYSASNCSRSHLLPVGRALQTSTCAL